jgi:hypothetical protein
MDTIGTKQMQRSHTTGENLQMVKVLTLHQTRSYHVQIIANLQNICTNSQSRLIDLPCISLFWRIFGSHIPNFGNVNVWLASVEPTGNLVFAKVVNIGLRITAN